MRKFLVALLSGSLLVVAASSAQAAEGAPTPSTDHPISVAALGGFGINNAAGDNTDSINIYGAGFGVRAGYTLPFKLYVGGLFQYNLGKSIDLPQELGGGSVKYRTMNLGGEVGYNFDIAQFTLRPYLGVGVGIAGGDLRFTAPSNGNEGTKVKFSLWPGVQGVYNFNDQLFAGLDVRYTYISSDFAGNANSLGFYGTVGYRF